MRTPLTALFSALLFACAPVQDFGPTPAPVPPTQEPTATTPTATMHLTINGTRFAVALAGNQASNALGAALPFTVSMGELNSNEKYHYLSRGLPTSPERPATIQAGDVMLFGSDCLVIFYKTCSNSYSYTRIGRVESPLGLEAALGRGSVNVTFSR